MKSSNFIHIKTKNSHFSQVFTRLITKLLPNAIPNSSGASTVVALHQAESDASFLPSTYMSA